MRKLLILFAVFCFTTISFASNDFPKEINVENPLEINKFESLEGISVNSVINDCTVRLNFTLEDGTTVTGTITFEDVSWWDCSKMQLAAWWKRNF